MTRPVIAEIDCHALKHNLKVSQQSAPQSKTIAVVKANGYGHGGVEVAKELQTKAAAFAVSSLEEAIELRDANISTPIVLLEGVFSADELPAVVQYSLTIVLHNQSQLEWLEEFCKTNNSVIKLWLKIDTGMHRLGFSPDLFPEVLSKVNGVDNIALIGFMTHFASADDVESLTTSRQLQAFNQAIGCASGERSAANSAAILAWEQSHYDWVRPGIMLYGISPILSKQASDHELLPVMTLKSQLIAINSYRKGDKLGYGDGWQCPEPMRVGVVATGYGDGYPRHAPSGTPVLINGAIVQLVGRVSMDMLMVDLRELPDAEVGDSVVMWGAGLPVEKIAEKAGTIAYELVCGVAKRVRRVYLSDNR